MEWIQWRTKYLNVDEGRAGAGTISMGGYDYHTGDRSTGEDRDFRAGVCMGACLEFAARRGVPLMLYVFSDGSLFSDGTIDGSAGGRGKGVWTGDNQSTAASFFLVFDPAGRPAAMRQQIGYYRASGDVETASHPGANAVNLLVETVILNYMALHGEQAQFPVLFPNHGLGSTTLRDSLTAFPAIVNGKSAGDLGRFERGFLSITGRKSDVIITGGVNVYPAEIEATLLAHPGVVEAAVRGVPDPEWGEAVCAFVVAKDVTERALIEHCARTLSPAKKPKRIVFLAELPKNASGKIDKRALSP